jgi:hypothetical protein
VLFVGSAALAQQGLVVDPWHKPVKSVAAPAPSLGGLPASGLPPLKPAPRIAARRPEAGASLATPAAAASETPETEPKWSPPVVPLLVDPWAGRANATGAPKPRWVPPTLGTIDPWANDARAEPPRVASRPAESGHSTIF